MRCSLFVDKYSIHVCALFCRQVLNSCLPCFVGGRPSTGLFGTKLPDVVRAQGASADEVKKMITSSTCAGSPGSFGADAREAIIQIGTYAETYWNCNPEMKGKPFYGFVMSAYNWLGVEVIQPNASIKIRLTPVFPLLLPNARGFEHKPSPALYFIVRFLHSIHETTPYLAFESEKESFLFSNFVSLSNGRNLVFSADYGEQQVVVKVFSSEELQKREYAMTLMAQKLDPENVPRVVKYVESPIGFLLITTPVAAPLAARMSFENANNIFSSMLKRLQKLADGGMTHNDIKPGNIVQVGCNFQFIDFGSAMELGEQLQREYLLFTRNFTSLSVMKNEHPTSFDDLESLVYSIVSLVRPLPWSLFDDDGQIQQLKEEVVGSELCDGFHANVLSAFNVARERVGSISWDSLAFTT